MVRNIEGTGMKARKYENVEFVINHSTDDVKLSLIWKKGGLYLSLSGLFLTDGETWYELPVRELENISVVSDSPLKLRIKIPSLDIMISGERAEKLLALRHFLLPYISGEKDDNDVKALLRFWGIEIRDVNVLSKLLNTEPARVAKLIDEAKTKGLIDGNGDLSSKGNNMFPKNENEPGNGGV